MDKIEYPNGSDPKELQVSMEPRTEYIVHKGKKWEFQVRGLPWVVKKKALSQACRYQPDGNVIFDWDIYFKLTLKAVIVQAPFPIDDAFLASLDSEVGELLESFVPNPWPDITIEASKKE